MEKLIWSGVEYAGEESGKLREYWKIKNTKSGVWSIGCNQWDNGTENEPTFYICTPSGEPSYEIKRPFLIPATPTEII